MVRDFYCQPLWLQMQTQMKVTKATAKAPIDWVNPSYRATPPVQRTNIPWGRLGKTWRRQCSNDSDSKSIKINFFNSTIRKNPRQCLNRLCAWKNIPKIAHSCF